MKLRVAQIRIVPEKGNMEKNFSMLLRTLKALEKNRPDVVITPECFLDGYVSTEDSVTKQSITRYAIDPTTSHYTKAISSMAIGNTYTNTIQSVQKSLENLYLSIGKRIIFFISTRKMRIYSM